jgi:hypothetical protein
MMPATTRQTLEEQHATDTIILWRTEAKLRLMRARDEPAARVMRQEYEELQNGVADAVFQVFQKIPKPAELEDDEKQVRVVALRG